MTRTKEERATRKAAMNRARLAERIVGHDAMALAYVIQIAFKNSRCKQQGRRLRVAALLYCWRRMGTLPAWARVDGRTIGPRQICVTKGEMSRALGCSKDMVNSLLIWMDSEGITKVVSRIPCGSYEEGIPVREFTWGSYSMDD